MKKGLLICSGGFSTTIIAKALNEVNDMNMTFEAVGLTGSSIDWQDSAKDFDVILLSPQIKFQHDKIKEFTEEAGIPTVVIARELYNPGKASILWSKVKDVVEKKEG